MRPVTTWVEVIRVRGIFVVNFLRVLLELEVNAVEIFLDPHWLGLVDHDFCRRWLLFLVAPIAPAFLAWLSVLIWFGRRFRFQQFLTGDAVAVGVEIG